MSRIGWNEPRFGKEEEEAVLAVIRNNYVNEGPVTRALELKFANFLGVKHTILTANGTAALYLAVKADQQIRGYDDFEVIVPDMTMIATATAVGWAGGTPILADVTNAGATISWNAVKKKITPKTKAIIPVHVLGRAAGMDGLERIAEEHGLILVEDAAGALASKDRSGRYLGTIGKVGCFSLQSNKIITTGQGGVVATNDPNYFEMMRRIRDFGRASNKEFVHMREGYNLKFNDLSAALGMAQFDRLEQRKNMLIGQKKQYKDELYSVEEVKLTAYFDEEVPLWVDAEVKDRKGLSAHLLASDIHARDCWPAVHRNPPYQNQGTDEDFPNASHISDNYLWLPNGPGLNEGDIKTVCDKIKEFYSKK